MLKVHNLIFIFFLLTLLSAGNIFAKGGPQGSSLAKVGDKIITVKDFLERSEFTVRPQNFKDKSVVLNNLIFEKLLALEAENNNQPVLSDLYFNAKVKGIKEQQMRDKLYQVHASDKITPDSAEIYKTYMLSIREYEVEYYVLLSDSESIAVERQLKNYPQNTDTVFKTLEKITGKKPVKTVNYLDPDDDIVTEVLYKSLLEKGAVVGPVKLASGRPIIMRINNWADHLLLGGVEQRERWTKVEDKIKRIKSAKLWNQYTSEIMKGKQLLFNEKTFEKISSLSYQYCLNKNLPDSVELRLTEIPSIDDIVNPGDPFFTIDGIVWRVKDFKQEILSHPLVFRAKFHDRSSYNNQFFLAIADLMRDHFLTETAYKEGLDASPDIASSINIWRDSFLASEQQKSVFESAFSNNIINKDNNPERLKFWQSYLTELKNKYSSIIEINYDALEKINLTKIDFLALQPGVPYPSIVPGFPILSTSQSLDYKGGTGIK